MTGGWRSGRIGCKSITKTDDHFDLLPFILPSSSRSRFSQCRDVIDVHAISWGERKGGGAAAVSRDRTCRV